MIALRYPIFKTLGGGCSAWTQFSDDHAFVVSFSDEGNVCQNMSLTWEGEDYTMTQFHVHAPSEHFIGGGRSDIELHIVHESKSGDLLVLGVLMDAILSDHDDGHEVIHDGVANDDTFTSGKFTRYQNTFLRNFLTPDPSTCADRLMLCCIFIKFNQ